MIRIIKKSTLVELEKHKGAALKMAEVLSSREAHVAQIISRDIEVKDKIIKLEETIAAQKLVIKKNISDEWFLRNKRKIEDLREILKSTGVYE